MATRLSKGLLQVTEVDVFQVNEVFRQLQFQIDKLSGLQGSLGLPTSAFGTATEDVAASGDVGDSGLLAQSDHVHGHGSGYLPNAHHNKSHIHSGDGSGTVAHSALSGLSADDHTQYAFLAGRSSGQVLKGGTGVADGLTLQATSGAGANSEFIKGLVGNNGGTQFFKASITDGFFIGNGTSPGAALSVATTGATFSGADWLVWFRHEATAASNELLFRLEHFSDTQAPQPIIAGIANRGSFSSKSAIQTGDHLLILSGRGYDGSGTNWGEYAVGVSDTSAQLDMVAAENWSGTGHGSYLRLYTTKKTTTSPVERFRINDAGFIGHSPGNSAVGDPIASFHAMADGVDYSHVWDVFSASSSAALIGRRARGSFASPTKALSGDVLFTFQARGQYDSTVGHFSQPSSGIDFAATEDFSSTAQGSEIRFNVTANTTTSEYTAWTVRNDGQLKNGVAGNETTGGSTPAFTNAPATNVGWLKFIKQNGTQAYIPFVY